MGLLEGKICLITGATRGIGRSIAERFAQEGGLVYANARKEEDIEAWIPDNLKASILPICFDLSDAETIRQAVLKIKKERGKLDVLVNNAGIVTNENLGRISLDSLRKMFEVNVFGLIELSQLVATRFMAKQKSGSIVNIASIVGVEGSKGQTGYSASKGAVISITKSMAKELAPSNVRVNAVAPGMIETERLKITIKDVYKDNIPEIGMGRLGKPQEIADACLYFASDLSSYTTGQIMVVGGGA